MLEKMITRCPECGRWISTERRNILGRFVDGYKDSTVVLSDMCEDIGDKIGLGGVGKAFGTAWGLSGGWAPGLNRVLKGDHYWFSCPCGWEGSTNDEECDMSEEYEQYCKEKEYIATLLEKGEKADNDPEYISIIDEISKNIGSISEPLFKSEALDILALCNYNVDRFPEALSAINNSLIIYDWSEGHGIKGMILKQYNSADFVCDAMIEFGKFFEDNQSDDGLVYYSIDYYHDEFLECYNKYIEKFCSISPRKRRYLTFSDTIVRCKENVLSMRLQHVPSELIFPEGEPSTGELYVANPVKPNIYYPSEKAEMCIFRDQLDELMTVLGTLGAKSVKFNEVRSSNANYDKSLDVDVKASGGYTDKYSGSAHVNHHGDDNLYRNLKDELNQGRTFVRGQMKPQEPQGLSWYPQMKDWQSLAYNRLVVGNTLTDRKRITSSLDSTISRSRKNQVEAEFKAIEAAGNVAVNVETQKVFKESMNLCWEYDVEFYPLSDYEKSNEKDNQVQYIAENEGREKPKFIQRLRSMANTLKQK